MTHCTIFKSLALAFIFALLFWGGQYARRGFWEPDEARFVYVAREMASCGSPVIPLRNGEIYGHKPPLMMWLIRLGAAVFPSPFGERLPVWIGAGLSMFSLFWIGTALRNRRTGVLAAVLAATSVGFWRVNGFGQIDALLCGFQMLALAAAITASGALSIGRATVVGLSFGMAVFAKGPVGLLVPGGILIVWNIFSRGEARRFRIGGGRTAWILFLALLVPALWLLAAWFDGAPGSYFREILFKQNVERSMGGYGHDRPWLYMWYNFPLFFLPWTVLLPRAIRRLRESDLPLLRKLVGWVAFVLLFFTIPDGKRAVYILLAYPGAALLVACAADAEPDACRHRLHKACAVLIAVLFATGTFGLPLLNDRKEPMEMKALAEKYLPGADERLLLYDINGETFAMHAERRGLVCAAARGLKGAERMASADARMKEEMDARGTGLAVFINDDAKDLETRFRGRIRSSGSFLMGSKNVVWLAYGPAPDP